MKQERTDKEIVKSFAGIKAGKTLKIEMIPVKGNTILSGIELDSGELYNQITNQCKMKPVYFKIIILAAFLSLACTTKVSEWVLLNSLA